MDPRLLAYYNEELQFVREMGGEFAQAYPKIAARLGLEGLECADPYVERLLEGFAFLAARIHQKLDGEFPKFTQHLLNVVYPHYLAPTPSIAVVRFQPGAGVVASVDGFEIPRDGVLRAAARGSAEESACEFRTAHDVTLWPIEVAEADYLTHGQGLSAAEAAVLPPGVNASLRLRLRTIGGVPFDKLSLDRLPIFLAGGELIPAHLYEQLVANVVGILVRPAAADRPWFELLPGSSLKAIGFDDSEALLPYGNRSFQGYRLLHEYFACPERFLFVEIQGLAPAIRRLGKSELEIVVLLDRADPVLEHRVSKTNFALFCSPAVNLFQPRAVDRVHVEHGRSEFHLVPDRTRPMDLEVYDVLSVVGHGHSGDAEQTFLPLFRATDWSRHGEDVKYFTARRVPRVLSAKQKETGTRAPYVGSEIFLALVDGSEAPYSSDLRELAVDVLCTNRDLSLRLPRGLGKTDFFLVAGGPVESIRCLAGPTPPRPSWPDGDVVWRLISHLSLNYLSLLDTDERQGAAAMRELLSLYSHVADQHVRAQIRGVRSVKAQPIVRRVPLGGPIAFGRGLGVTLTLAEGDLVGVGAAVFGAVLERFLARYVSINSFTETVLRTVERGEVMRWPIRMGQRHTI